MGTAWRAHKHLQAASRHNKALPPFYSCEAEVVEGLEVCARHELETRFGDRFKQRFSTDGVLNFDYKGDLSELLALRSVIAIYLVRRYAIPRPKALLGDQNFRLLNELIETARALAGPERYQTLYLSAAGANSSVMQRIKESLAEKTGLTIAQDEGDLLLRIRPTAQRDGWETLVRLSPRPLATRAWRVCNFGGALNATIAHVMATQIEPAPDDVFVNLACGSGTLLVERMAIGPAGRAIGCDMDASALACAHENLAASGCEQQVELHEWDASNLPLENASVDALCADLPFGHIIGSHEENTTLYPAILAEAARVAKPGARFALITHEVRMTVALLGKSRQWAVETVLRVRQGGLHPRIFVLRRL